MILCEDLWMRLLGVCNCKGISEYYPHITVYVSCGLLFNPNSCCVKTLEFKSYEIVLNRVYPFLPRVVFLNSKTICLCSLLWYFSLVLELKKRLSNWHKSPKSSKRLSESQLGTFRLVQSLGHAIETLV